MKQYAKMVDACIKCDSEQWRGGFMDYDEIDSIMKIELSANRYNHSLRVVDCAVALAITFECNLEKVRIAAISHDCAKELSFHESVMIAESENMDLDLVTLSEPQLLHGPVGRFVAMNKLKIWDEEVLDAIHYHTTGRANMSTLEKIIYLADIIEIGRTYPGIEEVRELSHKDLDRAILLAIDNTIQYVISIHSLLHPRTIEARNSIILKSITL